MFKIKRDLGGGGVLIGRMELMSFRMKIPMEPMTFATEPTF